MTLADRSLRALSVDVPARGGPPAVVRVAYWLWFVAVGDGVFETVLAVGRLLARGHGAAPAIAAGLAIRLPVFGAALFAAGQMRDGSRWARLALGLGILGTASMVVRPVQALVHGRTLAGALAKAGPVDLLFGASRTVHVTCVLGAVALMFLPAANSWFRERRRGR
jgi:hypothetical protein